MKLLLYIAIGIVVVGLGLTVMRIINGRKPPRE